jgi:Protein of unknown function, DUF481
MILDRFEMIKPSLFFIVFSLSMGKLFAQLNESDSIPWQIKFNTTGSVLDGNVARTVLLNRFEVAHANKNWGISTRNDYQYGRTRYILTESDMISYNFFYLKPLSKVYPYAMALIETNLRRKIDLRYQFGPGVTWNAIHTKLSTVKLSVTGTYEHTTYRGVIFDDEMYNGSNTIETWRMTGRIFGKHILKNKVRISYEFWWQQSLNESINYRFHTEEAIEFPLAKHIAFRTAFRYSHENIELVGLKPYDLFWTYGFTITNF